MVSFVSCDRIAFIDPQEEIYREERTSGSSTSSYAWNMRKDLADMRDIEDQWKPYFHGIFDFSKEIMENGW